MSENYHIMKNGLKWSTASLFKSTVFDLGGWDPFCAAANVPATTYVIVKKGRKRDINYETSNLYYQGQTDSVNYAKLAKSFDNFRPSYIDEKKSLHTVHLRGNNLIRQFKTMLPGKSIVLSCVPGKVITCWWERLYCQEKGLPNNLLQLGIGTGNTKSRLWRWIRSFWISSDVRKWSQTGVAIGEAGATIAAPSASVFSLSVEVDKAIVKCRVNFIGYTKFQSESLCRALKFQSSLVSLVVPALWHRFIQQLSQAWPQG